MAESSKIGTIGWIDLTVKDGEGVRDFYQKVVGWESTPVEMGDYNDYCMLPPGLEEPVAGVCHAQGANANVPPQWLIYIFVADLAVSLIQVQSLGGKIIEGPKGQPSNPFAIIQDPAGAYCVLCQQPS